MKVLVTGGSGFIGSHVVDKLINKGVDVRVFDGIRPTFRDDVEFYQGSLLDLNDLGFAMNGVDAVMHLAAVADVKDVFNEPHYAESINVRGTINVLEAARRSGVNRIVYGSTTWVYSEAAVDEVDETTPLRAPSHLYTATKLTGEYYCQSYSKLYGLEVTILRYGIPYGPRARDGAVIPIFVRKALNGESLTLAGDGLQFRKFIYVEDLAEGNVLALSSVAKNKIYNLDGTDKISIKQIAETIKKILGDVKIEYVPARPGDFSGKEVSSRLVAEELGWKPKINFEEGLKRYINWYKQRESRRAADLERLDKILK
ncbi:NAD-dependent epimerase/dehydratase family protein [Candidatus Omnitrophota bacterium]